MSARGWSLCIGVWLIGCLISAAMADESSLVGDLIYPKSSDVPIRAGNEAIGTASDLNTSARVRQVDGDLLCIWVVGKKTEGWIKRSDVCLAREAIDYFTEQIAAHPNDDKAYLSRAAAREELNELDNALEDATQAIRLNPIPRAFKSRGATWSEKKEFDKALADYDEAIRLDPKDAAAFYDRGSVWSEKKEHDRALKDYDEAIRLDPNDPVAYKWRTWAWLNKGEFDKVLADSNEAIRLDPRFASGYTGRGCALFGKSDFDSAIKEFDEAIRLNPKNVSAYANRGRAWMAKREFDTAIADFDETIRLDPQLAGGYGNRGIAWSAKGEFDKALADDNEAIRLDPKLTVSYFNRAEIWSAKGEPDKALSDFSEVIRLDPKQVQAFNKRAEIWLAKEEYDKAITDYDELIRLDPKHQSAHGKRGAAKAGKGNYDAAIADLSEAISLNPNDSVAYVNRGHSWLYKNESDKAIADYDEAIRLDPMDANSYAGRGTAWTRKAQWDNALVDFNEAIRFDPKIVAAYGHRAQVWLAKREFDKAIVDADEAVRLAPNDTKSHLLRAKTLSEKGDFDKAIFDFSEAIRLDPQNAASYVGRGNAWSSRRDFDPAIRDFDDALRLDPRNVSAHILRGDAWFAKRQLDKAIADYSEVIRLEPDNTTAYLRRAPVWLFQKSFHKTVGDLGNLVRIAIEANSSDLALADFRVNITNLTLDEAGRRIVATVNGVPLIAAEILERYAEALAMCRKSASPEEYRQMCDQLIQRDLRAHIEQKLLAEAMLATLTTKPVTYQKQFADRVKSLLAEQVTKMQTEKGVASTVEFDRTLHRNGTSRAMMAHQFRLKTLAQQFLAKNVLPKLFSRRDLLAYYEEHATEFELKPRVKWQRIQISRAEDERAESKRQALLLGLKEGRDFGELAVELSDALEAKDKGIIGWTSQGSLTDEALDELLFQLPIGQPSELMTAPIRFQVVRVLERQAGTRKTFEEVRDEILAKLTKSDQKAQITTLIDGLWKSATIESTYTIQAKDDFAETNRRNPKFFDPLGVPPSPAHQNSVLLGADAAKNDEATPNQPDTSFATSGKTWLGQNFENDDYHVAIQTEPQDANGFSFRARAWVHAGEFAKAIADFEQVIRLDPKFVSAYRRCAWVRATCPDASVRNGQKAVLDATKACELTDWKNDEALMVLAAALAEAGRLEEALLRLRQSAEMTRLNNTKLKAKMLARFQAGESYHEEPTMK